MNLKVALLKSMSLLHRLAYQGSTLCQACVPSICMSYNLRDPSFTVQALILLLAVLDIGKLIQIVREGKQLEGQSHRLGTAAAREAVDRELLAWGSPSGLASNSSSIHAALLLAWATFSCLSNSAAQPGGRNS